MLYHERIYNNGRINKIRGLQKKKQADSLITVKNEQYSEACDEKIEWLTNLNLFQKREWPHEK